MSCRVFSCVASLVAAALLGPGPARAQDAPADSATETPAPEPESDLTEFRDGFGVSWPTFDGEVVTLPEIDADARDEAVEDALDTETFDADAELSAAEALEAALAADEEAATLADRDAATDGFDDPPPRTATASDTRETDAGTLIRFVGLPDGFGDTARTRFALLSALEQAADDDDDDAAPADNVAQLRRRADVDEELLARLLRIEGYYDALVASRIEQPLDEPVTVRFTVEAGPRYRIGDVALEGIEAASDEEKARLREVFALATGEPLSADRIAEAQERLSATLAETGYAFADVAVPEIVVDHALRTGTLRQPIDLGERPGGDGRRVFGGVTLSDDRLFSARHVERIARFDAGDPYRASDVEDLRRALIATGLVSTIEIEPVPGARPGTVDLAIAVTPAPPRTIAGELGYGTGEGIRAEVSWEHRNLFPPEGLLRATAVLAEQEQGGGLAFRRNNFGRRDNVLNAAIAASNIDRPAFEARTLSLSANIERQSNLIYQKVWSWSVGAELIASEERDVTASGQRLARDRFFIGALPASVVYDRSDDLLDPTRGFRLGARVSPELSFQDGEFGYVRTQLDASAYVPANDRITVAGRARLGSIAGAGPNRIAPSRRLYAGGGGSVRGFGFQRIGPLDANGDPAGGRSLVEFALEARIRTKFFDGNLGLVPFIDAGNVYRDTFPDFSGLRFGAGVGLRYYSDFGPIRIDVGTPINPRPGDSVVAVSVSLGQAF